MTDLEAISEAPVPRPDRLTRRFAKLIYPTSGFVLYGVLYLFVVANTLGVLPLPLVMSITAKPAPAWVGYAWFGWYILAQILAWWLFGRWMQKRRRAAAAIVRDGEILTGAVTQKTDQIGRHWWQVAVGGTTLRPPIHLAGQQHCKVLFLAGAHHCFVFDHSGTAIPVGIGRGNPYGRRGGDSNIEPLPEARIVE